MTKYEWMCEAAIDWTQDTVGKPLIVLCRKPAKLHGMAALCDQHKHLAYPKEPTCDS